MIQSAEMEARNLLDTRVLGKPPVFTGEAGDGKVTWEEFSFILKSYVGIMSTEMVTDMDVIEANLNTDMNNSGLPAPTESLSRTLFYILVMLTKAEPLALVRKAGTQQGYEAWRCLCRRYQPDTVGRHMGVLQGVLSPELSATNFMADLVSWENRVRIYEEQSKESLSESIKTAVLLKHSPEEVRVHLQMNQELLGTDYQHMRRSIEGFLLARTTWSVSGASTPGASSLLNSKTTPMEVGAVQAKSKSKGKSDKGKSKERGGKGSASADSGTRSKGKDSSSAGKDKGSKGSGSSGGKSGQFEGYCGYCSKWGHKAKDCRQKQRDQGVAGVEQPNKASVAPAPVTEVHVECPPDRGRQECDEAWILAVHSEARADGDEGDWEELLVDSGSGVHVCPPSFGQELYPIDDTNGKVKMYDVQSKLIPHTGQRTMDLNLKDAGYQGTENDQRARVAFELGPVTRPILSVGCLVDKGASVHFTPEGAWMEQGDRVLNFKRRGGTFVVPTKVLPPKPSADTMVAPVEAEMGDAHLEPYDPVMMGDEHLVPYDPDEPAEEAIQLGGAEDAVGVDSPEADAGPGAVGLRCPHQPTDEERKAHELCHLPFQPWCLQCIGGKAKEDPHYRQLDDDTENDKPCVVQMDYCFMTADGYMSTPDKPDVHVIAVAVDVTTGYMGATQCSRKGHDPFVEKYMESFLDSLPHARVILQTDGEAAILDLAARIVKRRTKATGRRTTPRYSSASNGAVERAHQSLQGQVRTLRLDLEKRYPGVQAVSSTITPWLIRHAAWTLNRYQPHGPRKVTSFELVKHHRYTSPIAAFGETVMWKAANPATTGHLHKFDPKFQLGIWVGRSDLTDEHIVLDANGAHRGRSVRRLTVDEQVNAETFATMKGLPWDAKAEVPRRPRATGVPIAQPVPAAEPEVRQEARAERDRADQKSATTGSCSSSSSTESEKAGPVDEAMGPFESGPMDEAMGPSEEALHFVRASGEPPAEGQPAETAPGIPLTGDVAIGTSKRQVDVATEVIKRARVAATESHLVAGITEFGGKELDLDPTELNVNRLAEIQRLTDFEVFETIDRKDIPDGIKVLNTGWVDKHEKSRFVAKEYNTGARDDVFAYSSDASLSRVVELHAAKKGYATTVFDVGCAFIHASEEEFVCAKPPDEWVQEDPERRTGKLWRLRKQLYGRRKAPKAWQQHFTAITAELGFIQHGGQPSIFYRPTDDIVMDVHMDDGHAAGPAECLRRLLKELGERLLLKHVGIIDGSEGADRYSYLKQNKQRIGGHIATKPRDKYVDDVLKLLELEGCKPVSTPGVKGDMPGDDELLENAEAALYRTCVGKLLYYGHNQRGDVQYTIKELSRHVSKPTERAMRKLKRVARYLKGAKELVSVFGPEGRCDAIRVYVDSDWAGCGTAPDEQKLKSTSGCVIQVGQCTLHTHSRTQQTFALSSGEAEYIALTAGVAEALLLRDVLEFLQYGKLPIVAYSDSSAARGIASRRGVGRVRHLELRELWLQSLVGRGIIKLRKIDTKNNPADLLTKEVDAATLKRLRPQLGLMESSEIGNEPSWAVSAVAVENGKRRQPHVPGQVGLPRLGGDLRRVAAVLTALASLMCTEGAETSRGKALGGVGSHEIDMHVVKEATFVVGAFLWLIAVPCVLILFLWTAMRIKRVTVVPADAEVTKADQGVEQGVFISPFGERYHRSAQCRALEKTPPNKLRCLTPCLLCMGGDACRKCE